MNKTLKKAKPFLVTGAVALVAITLMNTLARRSTMVRKVQSTVNRGF